MNRFEAKLAASAAAIAAAGAAQAQQPAPGDGGTMSIFFMVAIFVVFYFLMIRPQVKRQKELKSMIDALGKGDEIVTTGGLVGRITELGDQYITLQVASLADKAVEVSVQRGAVQTLLPKGTLGSLGVSKPRESKDKDK